MYACPINSELPMGWTITVKTSRVTYTFVVEETARVFSLERKEGRQILLLASPDLLGEAVPRSC